MRDNDIRKIFDSAVEENTRTDIDAEKLQNTVMERLGKGRSENIRFYESGDPEKRIDPVIVTAPAKRSHKAAVIVSAAVACLAVTAISTGFFGIRGGFGSPIISAGDKSDTPEQTDLSAAETVREHTAAETPAPQINVVEAIGEKFPFNNNSLTFLDGTEIVIKEDKPSAATHLEEVDWLLSEDSGRVFYWNGKEKKDVTDLISMEAPYIDSYKNEGSGLTHYIVIWGDIASGKYGYAEMVPTNERAWFFEMVLNRWDPDDEEEWSKETEKILSGPIDAAIRQISGEEWYMRSGVINRIYFKSVTLPCDR